MIVSDADVTDGPALDHWGNPIKRSISMQPLTGKCRPLSPYTIAISLTLTPPDDWDQSYLLVGGWIVWLNLPNGIRIREIDRGTFSNPIELFRAVREYLPRAVMVSANGQIDAGALMLDCRPVMQECGFAIDPKNSIVSLPGKDGYGPFKTRLDFGRKRKQDQWIEMRSLGNIYPGTSMDTISKAAGIDRLPAPDDPTDREAGADWNMRECEIIGEAWFALHRWTWETFDVTPGLTAASTGERIFRRKFLPKNSGIRGNHGYGPEAHERDGIKGASASRINGLRCVPWATSTRAPAWTRSARRRA